VSLWGQWTERGDDGSIVAVHVVPCDNDRRVLNKHEQSETCWCKPRRDDNEPRVIVHNDPQRGGFDA
jgi:hypothetical protein